jgi:hypothetical protein
MNKLTQALQRLYFFDDQQWHSQKFDDGGNPAYVAKGALRPELVAKSLAGQSTVALDLVNSDGMVRAMVLGFERATDWDLVAKLYQGIQEDFELPAPAVSISGQAGYQLWLSLAECIPVAEARLFIDALRRKYLIDIPLAKLRFSPDAGAASLVNLVPALHEASGKWSAFIDPSMGAMFVDEPGLSMAPNMDRQADMLAGLKSMKAVDFQRALNSLQSEAEANARLPEQSAVESGVFPSAPDLGRMRSTLNVGNNYTDPKTFLLAVMNDASASPGQRIKAAKALLPYFNGSKSERDVG